MQQHSKEKLLEKKKKITHNPVTLIQLNVSIFQTIVIQFHPILFSIFI